jgi:hypothetical protein
MTAVLIGPHHQNKQTNKQWRNPALLFPVLTKNSSFVYCHFSWYFYFFEYKQNFSPSTYFGVNFRLRQAAAPKRRQLLTSLYGMMYRKTLNLSSVSPQRKFLFFFSLQNPLVDSDMEKVIKSNLSNSKFYNSNS